MDFVLHEQSRTCDAGLTAGCEDACNRASDSIFHDAIVEDDVGRLAAEFEDHWFQMAGGRLIDAFSRLPAARERDLGDLGMGGDRLAGLGTEARDDVEDAG